jgi:hypothetical protein
MELCIPLMLHQTFWRLRLRIRNCRSTSRRTQFPPALGIIKLAGLFEDKLSTVTAVYMCRPRGPGVHIQYKPPPRTDRNAFLLSSCFPVSDLSKTCLQLSFIIENILRYTVVEEGVNGILRQ